VLVQRDASLLNKVFLAMIVVFMLRSADSGIVQYITFYRTPGSRSTSKQFFVISRDSRGDSTSRIRRPRSSMPRSTNLPQMQRFMIGSHEVRTRLDLILAGMGLMLLRNKLAPVLRRPTRCGWLPPSSATDWHGHPADERAGSGRSADWGSRWPGRGDPGFNRQAIERKCYW
jgi:hypothetical protein